MGIFYSPPPSTRVVSASGSTSRRLPLAAAAATGMATLGISQCAAPEDTPPADTCAWSVGAGVAAAIGLATAGFVYHSKSRPAPSSSSGGGGGTVHELAALHQRALDGALDESDLALVIRLIRAEERGLFHQLEDQQLGYPLTSFVLARCLLSYTRWCLPVLEPEVDPNALVSLPRSPMQPLERVVVSFTAAANMNQLPELAACTTRAGGVQLVTGSELIRRVRLLERALLAEGSRMTGLSLDPSEGRFTVVQPEQLKLWDGVAEALRVELSLADAAGSPRHPGYDGSA